jgi:hypothetical protein
MLVDVIARDYGFALGDICGGVRGKSISRAKRAFIEMAYGHGHRLCKIAAALNCSPAAVTLLRKRKS